MTRGKSARNLAQDRIRLARQQILPRFHSSVSNKENVLQIYRSTPDLFVEHQSTLDQLERIYSMLKLYCLDPKFTNTELLENLPWTQTYSLVALMGAVGGDYHDRQSSEGQWLGDAKKLHIHLRDAS